MINEFEVKKYCQRYGFKYKYINENSVLVQSKYDSWRIDCDGKSSLKPLQLYHQNTRHNTRGEHKQRRFRDIPFLIRSIKQHDDHTYYMLFKKRSRLDRLFERIGTST